MTFHFEIRARDYTWPEPLGKKGEAALVIEDAGRIECGRMLAGVDNYPYIVLELFCDDKHIRVDHRHSRLYWDGCAWARERIDDFEYDLPKRVRLVINGKEHSEVDYDQFVRVVRETNGEGRETLGKCRVAITDPRVRYLALASLSYFDENAPKAKCAIQSRLNLTREEALTALRRFGLDVPFANNPADQDLVYGHLQDYCKASKSETPAQIVGRTIPIRIECSDLVDCCAPQKGRLDLKLVNGPIGVMLRGEETVGGTQKTYSFRVPTEWARKNVVSVIERMSVSPFMPTDREGYPNGTEIRIVKGDAVFSAKWGNMTGGTWNPLVRMAKKLRLVYDMLKENAAADIEETEPRLLGEFKIAAVGHVKGAEKACSLLAPGAELRLERDKDNPHDANAIKVVKAEDGVTLGYVQKTLNAELASLMDEYVGITAKVEASCSHLGKHSACVVVVRNS